MRAGGRAALPLHPDEDLGPRRVSGSHAWWGRQAQLGRQRRSGAREPQTVGMASSRASVCLRPESASRASVSSVKIRERGCCHLTSSPACTLGACNYSVHSTEAASPQPPWPRAGLWQLCRLHLACCSPGRVHGHLAAPSHQLPSGEGPGFHTGQPRPRNSSGQDTGQASQAPKGK